MKLNDRRTFAQRWADIVTEFSGSWLFIWWFCGLVGLWIVLNLFHKVAFDPYPFLFLNWTLTVISTLQSPLIMMSNNRQNDFDRENIAELNRKLDRLLTGEREAQKVL